MNRKEQRQQWLTDYFKGTDFRINPASEDASFRSYFRVSHGGKTYILMDAPPEHEDCRPFIKVLKLLAGNQVNVPELFATDLDQGFLLLGDLGDQLYLTALNDDESLHESLYKKAIDTLLSIQKIAQTEAQLPAYDEYLLMTEMQLFKDWFIVSHLGYFMGSTEIHVLEDAFALLTDNALAQPKVMVHRDYHSRNLMVIAKYSTNSPTIDTTPGVIDFQDAVLGPFTYDLASLLKDCYISWPDEVIEPHCRYYLQQYNNEFNTDIEMPQFMRWFDLMAAQRHLKAIGIFCRLNYRDGKSDYLYDIPRTMNYLLATAAKYPELADFHQLLVALQPSLPMRISKE